MSNPSQIQGQSQGGESCKPRLSPRETQILKLMAAGYRNKETADALAIGEHTTESHNRRLFRKLGVRSRLHASHRALDLGLLMMAADDHNRVVSADIGDSQGAGGITVR